MAKSVSCMQFYSLQTVFEPKCIGYYTVQLSTCIIISGAVLPLVPYSWQYVKKSISHLRNLMSLNYGAFSYNPSINKL